ncbi:5275_t:CDS:2 [Funneliformis mosseae]|uniref:5275_t:CDS:1 n=1 Tax=Funneliformis mosseae TaxID=27381 RepID=A0A9N8VDP2_FUNMO|nr:5275_t:CDS:2 [Funneliformis mosseae]
MTSIAKELLKNSTYPIIKDSRKHKNLFELINVFPNYGVGLKVAPNHWIQKGIRESYFEITKVNPRMKNINHGKAFGIKVWKGKVLNENEERIHGALKWGWYRWKEGRIGGWN